MRNMYYVDMHCHPSTKPYSFYFGNGGRNYDCRNERSSLWYNDPPDGSDRELNRQIGLTRFSQSDFRTLTQGDVRIISACLNTVERGLFRPRGIFRRIGLRLLGFGLELHRDFIEHVRADNRNYFDELNAEYQYFLAEEAIQDNHPYPTRFVLTNHFGNIDYYLGDDDCNCDHDECICEDRIYVFFSIEGSHVFNNGGLANRITDHNVVTRNVQLMKAWDHPPLYVSMAHHIYNYLCGHAQSLPSPLHFLISQGFMMDTGFAPMGWVVLFELLSDNNGPRVHIDVKHMSAESRRQYYIILDWFFENADIPIIASHSAVNGRPSVANWDEDPNNEVIAGPVGAAEAGLDAGVELYQNEDNLGFKRDTINYFDDEIVRIERSGGFIGIQLDERLLSSAEVRRRNRGRRSRGIQLPHQAGLVWKQIRYIAEVLNRNGRPAWDTACIGSDYDGAVDPPNGYWTSADFGILEENLIDHAVEYFTNYSLILSNDNQLNNLQTPEERAVDVIDRFMRRNAVRYLTQFHP